MAEVYLSLGSNMGDKRKFLEDALVLLRRKISGLKTSSLYITKPWGNRNQADFLNLCVSGSTDLPPRKLLDLIKSIEKDLGRRHREKWGPREIDIDIIFYDDLKIRSDELEIPHPYAIKRAFVLLPLAEIAPDLAHPVIGRTMKDLADGIGSEGIEKIS